MDHCQCGAGDPEYEPVDLGRRRRGFGRERQSSRGNTGRPQDALILKPVAEIRDPVHGYVKVTEVERDLVDSPFVQRLRRVHQLAGSYLVYPGALHTRFEHVIGAMHVAGQIAESLVRASEMDEDLVQEVRVAALLHDVGHGPFSHMYEEVLSER